MKIFIILVSLLLGTVFAFAKEKKETLKPHQGLSTNVRFGDQTVGGRYQLPMEALSVVENEKSIDDLIGVRKNFKDRITRSKGMR